MSKSIIVKLPELFDNFDLPESITHSGYDNLNRYYLEVNDVPNAKKNLMFIPELNIQGLVLYNVYKDYYTGYHTDKGIEMDRVRHLTGNNRYDFICIKDDIVREYRVPSTEHDIYEGHRETTMAIYQYVLDHPECLHPKTD